APVVVCLAVARRVQQTCGDPTLTEGRPPPGRLTRRTSRRTPIKRTPISHPLPPAGGSLLFQRTACSRCRLPEEAGLETLPPPGQGSPTWPVHSAPEALPIQLLVARGPDIGVNGQPQGVGVDAEQVEVEQRVDVGPQEQPVRRVVVLLAAIG